MYCVECGSSLPNDAQFCPRCGKRHGTEETAFSDKSSEAAKADESEANPPIPSSESASEAGAVRRFVWENLEPDSATPPASTASVTTEEKAPARYANAGSIIMGVVALTCTALGAIQGFIPIFLIEGVAFGGLAWLCAVKWPLSQSLLSVVFVASILFAGLVGVTLDQDSFGPRYRYLSQGSVQYRVDERAGRTDRLGSSGWYPVAYDREAQELPPVAAIWTVNLTKGEWTSGSGGKICFSAVNSSEYTVDRITIAVQIQKKSDAQAGKDGATDKDSANQLNPTDQQVVLKSYGGGFIGTGDTALVCAPSPRDLTADDTWSYTDEHIYGWKR